MDIIAVCEHPQYKLNTTTTKKIKKETWIIHKNDEIKYKEY